MAGVPVFILSLKRIVGSTCFQQPYGFSKVPNKRDTIHNVDSGLFHILPIVTYLSAKQMVEICFV